MKIQGHGERWTYSIMLLLFIGVTMGIILWLVNSSVTLVVTNKKCAPIRIPAPPVPIPGLHIPTDPVQAGEEGILQLPPLTVGIDAMHPDVTVVRLFDIPIPVSMPDDVIASFDGVRLVKTEMTVRLGEKPIHTLFISCRERSVFE